MAGLGAARRDQAGRGEAGKARRGWDWSGKAWQEMAGEVGLGEVRRDLAWRDTAGENNGRQGRLERRRRSGTRSERTGHGWPFSYTPEDCTK
jgi:hypothetical protein